jgi:hypothetical protein
MTDFYAPAANDLDSGNGHVVEAGPAKHGGTIRVETRRMDAIVSAAGVERLDLIKIRRRGIRMAGSPRWREYNRQVQAAYRIRIQCRKCFSGGGTPELISKFLRTHRYRLFSIGQTWAPKSKVTNGRSLGIFGPYPSLEADCRHSYTTTTNPNLNRLIPARAGVCEDFPAEKYQTRVG